MSLSRRRLLRLGAGSAAVAAGGAALAGETGLARRVWRHFTGGCAGPDGPVPPAPPAAPVAGSLRSRHVAGEVGYRAWRPDGSGALPVVVCLPGRGSTAGWILDTLHMHAFLAAAAERAGTAIGLAAVDGGESYWHARRDGEDRMAMLRQELLPLLASRFGLGAGGRPVVLAGWSMGGYGALLAADREPDRFAAVAAASPAVWPSWSDVWVPDAFDGPADFRRNDVFGSAARLDGLPIWLGCGTVDAFRANTERLARALGRPAHVRPGGHDACLWRLLAPAQMRFCVAALHP